MNNILKNNKGTSLIELIVALSLFVVVILAATGIFQSIMNGQRSAIAAQDVQENMRYAFETMSKEIRTAKKSEDGDCSNVTDGLVYEENIDELFFKNQYGECVSYYLLEDNGIKRLVIVRDDSDPTFVTPDEVDVLNLFFLADNEGQPRVTLMIEAESLRYSKYSRNMKIQTTISSRYYE